MKDLTFLSYLRGIYNLNLRSSSKVHQAIIEAIYKCFIMAEEDLQLSRCEMCLSDATGIWLDSWGAHFAIYRKSQETDEVYRQRIIQSVIQPKSTIPAIQHSVLEYLNAEYHEDYTENDIVINEPWKHIAKYSHKGLLSNNARFYSPDYYCHAILEIVIPQEITKNLVDLVNTIKAAGVKIIWTVSNQYDIITDFSHHDNVWADYLRHIQTCTNRNKFSGLVLSDSYKYPTLSGHQELWSLINSYYEWYAYIKNPNTDESILITKWDLLGLLSSFLKSTVIDGQTVYEETQISQEILQELQELKNYMRLSQQGELSDNTALLFEFTSASQLWQDLMLSLQKFKENHLEYYNSVQPPILNGEKAMWLIPRNKNWLWSTPLMSYDDFQKYWEPMDGYTEHTINGIVEFEETYYNKYITFGDKYQAPIVIGSPVYWSPIISRLWMFDSPAFSNTDLESIFAFQIYSTQGIQNIEPTLEDIISLEESYESIAYAHICDEQPEIEIRTEIITNS